jgi:hypothetical protein
VALEADGILIRGERLAAAFGIFASTAATAHRFFTATIRTGTVGWGLAAGVTNGATQCYLRQRQISKKLYLICVSFFLTVNLCACRESGFDSLSGSHLEQIPNPQRPDRVFMAAQ